MLLVSLDWLAMTSWTIETTTELSLVALMAVLTSMMQIIRDFLNACKLPESSLSTMNIVTIFPLLTSSSYLQRLLLLELPLDMIPTIDGEVELLDLDSPIDSRLVEILPKLAQQQDSCQMLTMVAKALRMYSWIISTTNLDPREVPLDL